MRSIGLIFCWILPFLLQIPSIKAENVKVAYVSDGDTFGLVDGRKIRMLGIDTPELYYEDYYAEDAKQRLKALIGGKRVALQTDAFSDDTDRYGRYLRYVHFMERDLNLQLIAEGYAKVYGKYEIERLDDYYEAEKQAKEQRLGLWQNETALARGQELLFYGLGFALLLFVAIWQTMRRIRRKS
ncbi:MAG: thermonuclease family protein [Bacteroidota bacterium]